MTGADDSVKPHVFVVAGEASGDNLGAAVISELKRLTDGQIRFSGVGGPAMEQQGLASLFPMTEFSVVGLSEIISSLPRLFRRADDLTDAVCSDPPDIVLTIDFKGFNFRLGARLKKLEKAAGLPPFRLVHMVAPTVWVWRKGRAKTIAGFLDRLLTLFPFELPYFEKHGLRTEYVGHPAISRKAGNGVSFRKRHHIPEDATVLGVFPGSRRSEVTLLSDVFSDTVQSIDKSDGPIYTVTPVVSTVEGLVRQLYRGPADGRMILVDQDEKQDAMAAMDGALAASGTVALELAFARVPTVVGYRVNGISTAISYLLRLSGNVVLTNWIVGREVVPQFLRGDCRTELLVPAVQDILFDSRARGRQIDACDEAIRIMSDLAAPPAEMAARAILDEIDILKSKRAT